MDDLDRKLISLLQKDARMPVVEIAEELGRPDTTIHFRTRRLRERVVKRFSALVSPEALGYNVSALLKVEIGGHIIAEFSTHRTTSFAEEMAEQEEFLWVAVSSEPMTIYALLMGNDNADLEKRVDRIRKSPDVVKVTMTMLSGVLKGWEISSCKG
ncbi:MAG: Lrp/AsnC family transcriptional regulator [Candidatus Thorarchaeota archaeon]